MDNFFFRSCVADSPVWKLQQMAYKHVKNKEKALVTFKIGNKLKTIIK